MRGRQAVRGRNGMPRNFWMITCNEENYNITREMDFTKQGLKSEYRRKVQRVEKDDRLLYYVMGIRKFTATATVTASYKEEDGGVSGIAKGAPRGPTS